MKVESTFTLSIVHGDGRPWRTLIGIPRDMVVTLSLNGLNHGKVYEAPISRIHQAMARMHPKRANPTGKKRRRFWKGTTKEFWEDIARREREGKL